jgi:hypothetical protein
VVVVRWIDEPSGDSFGRLALLGGALTDGYPRACRAATVSAGSGRVA